MERYNPTNTLSGEERARMSAKMVGLDMPKRFEDSELEGKVPRKGSLRSMGGVIP